MGTFFLSVLNFNPVDGYLKKSPIGIFSMRALFLN
jgi:hypothetical protein